MPTYTVRIEASNDDGTIWQALAPAETVEDDTTAEDLAAEVASFQNIAEGAGGWRVRVWNGADADEHSEPDAEYVMGEDNLIAELRAVRLRIAGLTGQRDYLVYRLMQTSAPRSAIATAAGVKEARLYQIRDEYRAATATSYTETFDLSEAFAVAELGMTSEMDDLLNEAIREHDDAPEISTEIEEAITAKLREHGVMTDSGEWLGEWSAENIVRGILTRHGIACP